MGRKPSHYVSTTNGCKLCAPMGAALAFRGVEGAVSFLHGSQGCATYMRRYLISHFNEPMDIASSALGEKHAVYGGGPNLKQGLANVTAKYQPQVIGIATTCLTETIGDDLSLILHEYQPEGPAGDGAPLLVTVSTPSYAGTHVDGFRAAVLALVRQLAMDDLEPGTAVNLLPGLVSPADLRYLKRLFADFALPCHLLPDFSDTLDGPALREYPLVPAGGTPVAAIRAMGAGRATVELGGCLPETTAGSFLAERFGVPLHRLGLPIGIRQSDLLLETLAELSGREIPGSYRAARGRLVDAMVDGHKYVYGKRVVIYGEEDLVAGLAGFLAEIGMQPVLCASGGRSGLLSQRVRELTSDLLPEEPLVLEGADFYDIEQEAARLAPDLLLGNSKGYAMSRRLQVPLLRVGFPIHDRIGGQRILHLGYHGAQALFDLLVNTVIACKQDASEVGYSYM